MAARHRLGAQTQVTSLPLDVGAFALSPDGSRLAVALEVFVDCGTIDCTKQRLDAREKNKTTGQLYDRLFVRHWDTWSDGRRSHVFVVPVAGGTPVDVMKGMEADAPSKPFGGSEEFTFTPTATRSSSRRAMRAARRRGRQLRSVRGAGRRHAKPRNLTADNKAWDTGPSFSPDGRTLAYKAMTKAGYEADRFRIVLRPWPDGAPKVLTEAWDRSPEELVWSADGKTIYTTADNVGQKSLFAIDAATGAARTVVNEGHIGSPVAAGRAAGFPARSPELTGRIPLGDVRRQGHEGDHEVNAGRLTG